MSDQTVHLPYVPHISLENVREDIRHDISGAFVARIQTYNIKVRDMRDNQIRTISITNKFEDLYQTVASQFGVNLDDWNMILTGAECGTIDTQSQLQCILIELEERPSYTIRMLLAPRLHAISAPIVGGSRKHSRKAGSKKTGSKKAGSKKTESKKAGSKKRV